VEDGADRIRNRVRKMDRATAMVMVKGQETEDHRTVKGRGYYMLSPPN
jgi:hypothetical protein